MNIFKGTSYKNAPTGELKKYQFFDFADFCEKALKKCQTGSKFEGYITIGNEYKITKSDPDAHFKSYKYKDHFHRNNPSQISAGIIPFDGDNSKNKAGSCIEPILVHEVLKEKNLAHCIYTTHSHRTKEHPDKIRWRLFLPCKLKEQGQLAPSIINLYELISKNGCENLAMATESKTWSVPWFLPTRDDPDDGKFEFYSYYEGDDFTASEAEAESISSETIISDDKISMDDMVLTIMNGTPDTGVHIAMTKYIHGQKKDGVSKSTVLANLKAFIHNWPYDDYHKRYYADMIRDLNNIYKKKQISGDWDKSWGHNGVEFCKLDFPKPKEYLSPWVREESSLLIIGERGVGKSWFAYGLSQAITSGDDFCNWKVSNKANVVYLDGEMGRYDNQNRMKLLGLNKQKNFTLICNHQTGIEGGVIANLVHEEYREWFKTKLIETNTEVVILDNVSCLSPGINENSKDEWDEINQWLISLRHAGITNILIHHMGKDISRGGRGAISREDATEVVLHLIKPSNYVPEDKARMEVKFKKNRIDVDNVSDLSDVEVKLVDGKWKFKKGDNNQKILQMLHTGASQEAVAKAIGISQPMVSKVKVKAIKDGIMDKNGKLIAFDLLENMEKKVKE